MGMAVRLIPDGMDGFRCALTDEGYSQPDGAPRRALVLIVIKIPESIKMNSVIFVGCA
jgi:hypothetical protein